jgi:hypothetical protein
MDVMDGGYHRRPSMWREGKSPQSPPPFLGNLATMTMDGLIQQQLSTDAVAFTQLPYILASLQSHHFTSPGSCSKWVARLNSLARAKDPLARWTGLCLILKTCKINTQLQLENSETWISLSLPLLAVSISYYRTVNAANLAHEEIRNCSSTPSHYITSYAYTFERDTSAGVSASSLNSHCTKIRGGSPSFEYETQGCLASGQKFHGAVSTDLNFDTLVCSSRGSEDYCRDISLYDTDPARTDI